MGHAWLLGKNINMHNSRILRLKFYFEKKNVLIYAINLLYEPRQANLCLWAFRHDKF